MFDLEKLIAEWREQMLGAGVKSPAPLEELESHLREDIKRLVQSGSNEKTAFAISARHLGRPQILKTEFRKNEGTVVIHSATIALCAGVVMFLVILSQLYVRGWRDGVVSWNLIVSGEALILLGLGTLVFNFKLGGARDLRFWKLVGVAYSLFAAWKSLHWILVLFNWPEIGTALFGQTAAIRVLVVAAAAGSILSVFGWRSCHGILPVVHDQRTRTFIGLACCLSGPGFMALFFYFVKGGPGHFSAPLFMVLMAWAWTAVAVLGGVGYGLIEAACRETTAPNS